MSRARSFIFACLIGLIATAVSACSSASRRTSAAGRPSPTTRAVFATTQKLDPNALLRLEQIEPKPVLPAASATTAPSEASLEALGLYAKARAALLDNRRQVAISLLEKALLLDPSSFELYFALGRANQGGGAGNDKAIEAYEKAIELRPDDISARLQLGRLYLTAGMPVKAIDTLRVALLTEEYKKSDDQAAVADLLLARALQQKGYDTAALEQYTLLQERLSRPTSSVRSNPELVYLMNRPEVVLSQIAGLNERLGNFEEALKAYEKAAEHEPGNFDLVSRSAQMLANLGRWEEASAKAAEAVTRFRASNDSLALLRQIYKAMGRESAVVEELTRLHKQRPSDEPILFTLIDVLKNENRASEAERVLVEAVTQSNYDPDIVKRLFRVYEQRGDVPEAARLLIETLAAHPDAVRDTTSMWSELVRLSHKNRLRLPELQKLEVSPKAQASKLFWISRVADLWNRETLGKSVLQQATKLDPPFPPAFRVLVGQIWNRPDWDEQRKSEACKELAESARQRGAPALAAEILGLNFLNEKKGDRAIESFAQALKLGNTAADLQLEYASALFVQGQTTRGEQMLWKLIGDYPTYEDAYRSLFQYYLTNGSAAQAIKVMQTWLAADPTSVNARVLQASVYLQAKRADAAEQVINSLLAENGDDAQVLASAQDLYMQTGRLDEFIAKLDELRTKNPENREAVERLVLIYADQKRNAEATRVLDATRTAVSKDADLLYYVSHLYQRIDQKSTAEEILQEVVRLDPTHAGAANDLGYTWADEGRNLKEAESLVRAAVQEEPDNESFLDSLGWVLYKRGNFEESRKYLAQSLHDAIRPDPVVLDHMGDVLYRLGQRTDAAKFWQQAQERMAEMASTRDDLQKLKLQLIQKLQQVKGNGPVNVAPVVEGQTENRTAVQAIPK